MTPRYWARGVVGQFHAWRSSQTSQPDAQALADAAAARIDAKMHDDRSDELERYGYADRPLREEVMQRVDEGAAITRNAYGARILNTERVVFVDVDTPVPKAAKVQRGLRGPGFLARLFGGAGRDARPIVAGTAAAARGLAGEAHALPVVRAAQQWVDAHPAWGLRVYRTRAGYRVLVTHATLGPTEPIVRELFAALQADPLYVRLCMVQQCFRARLTPKPWRIEVNGRPPRWPWDQPGAEARFRKWDARYQSAAVKFATCEHVISLGASGIDPSISDIVRVHDEQSGVGSGRPLA